MSDSSEETQENSYLPALIVFSLDESDSKSLQVDIESLGDASNPVKAHRRYVAPYVGEFQGFCVSVAASVVGSAIYSVGLKLLSCAKKLGKGKVWISLDIADAIVRNDIATELGLTEVERLVVVDLERRKYASEDMTSTFHAPAKGYLFLYRDNNGRKHYYEVSTDGKILLYKRYSRDQKSMLELMEGRHQ
jgi:hypothetical protein